MHAHVSIEKQDAVAFIMKYHIYYFILIQELITAWLQVRKLNGQPWKLDKPTICSYV